MQNEAGLDQRNFQTMRQVGRAMCYTRQEAEAAANRHANIDHALQPTRAGFERKYIAHSTQHARDKLGVEIPFDIEFGNRIYLPSSSLASLLGADPEIYRLALYSLPSRAK